MCDEKTLGEIFKAFDSDGSGKIDMKELTEVMKAYYKAVGETADEKKCKETAAVSLGAYIYLFKLTFMFFFLLHFVSL